MRRVVTANDRDGTSRVVSDGEPPTTLAFGANSVMQLWALERGGSDWGDTDPTIGLPLETDLVAYASRWVLIEFGPGGAADMHTTDTVDLGYVIDGEVTLVLDHGDVVLRRGDVLVQQGTRHAWRNEGAVPCRLLVHVVSSKPGDPANRDRATRSTTSI
jgi:quercetin dioxygenase-like cupin family protein